MFSPFFPEGFCLPFAATSPAAYALKLKPPKTPKLQSEEGSYLKTEEFVEVLFQKLYEIIGQYSIKIHETFWASH